MLRELPPAGWTRWRLGRGAAGASGAAGGAAVHARTRRHGARLRAARQRGARSRAASGKSASRGAVPAPGRPGSRRRPVGRPAAVTEEGSSWAEFPLESGGRRPARGEPVGAFSRAARGGHSASRPPQARGRASGGAGGPVRSHGQRTAVWVDGFAAQPKLPASRAAHPVRWRVVGGGARSLFRALAWSGGARAPGASERPPARGGGSPRAPRPPPPASGGCLRGADRCAAAP